MRALSRRFENYRESN